MSTYNQVTKHPTTGEWEEATWHDDFFGQHNYGVEFADGSHFDPRKVTLKTRHCETCNCE